MNIQLNTDDRQESRTANSTYPKRRIEFLKNKNKPKNSLAKL
jgi:hypothetical protein